MFEIGDYIVKAGEGVCKVDCKTVMKIPGDGREVPYYLLVPVSDPRIKVYLPVADEYPEIRPVMSRNEAEDLVVAVKGIHAAKVESEKARENTYREAIRSCSPEKLVGIIKHMYLRSAERQAHGKKTTAMDDRYFAMAEKALYSELGFVLDKSNAEVKELIIEYAES
ncbi:MAG: hypothetical protein IIY77_10160 [Lachnospiraceae bacterium]|nr:hypothetical protein [Lachnospiraceae bacterium]